MKPFQAFTFFILLLAATSVSALHHHVQVWMKRSGEDGGNNVEVTATVTYRYSGNHVKASATKKLPETTDFGGNGSLLLRKSFFGDPLDIVLRVYEEDQSSGYDGVCYLVIKPAYVEGTTEYRCIRQGDDGLNLDWIVRMRISMVEEF